MHVSQNAALPSRQLQQSALGTWPRTLEGLRLAARRLRVVRVLGGDTCESALATAEPHGYQRADSTVSTVLSAINR